MSTKSEEIYKAENISLSHIVRDPPRTGESPYQGAPIPRNTSGARGPICPRPAARQTTTPKHFSNRSQRVAHWASPFNRIQRLALVTLEHDYGGPRINERLGRGTKRGFLMLTLEQTPSPIENRKRSRTQSLRSEPFNASSNRIAPGPTARSSG